MGDFEAGSNVSNAFKEFLMTSTDALGSTGEFSDSVSVWVAMGFGLSMSNAEQTHGTAGSLAT